MINKTTNKKYKCIFFDLDHTLWDYDTNSRETLFELYEMYAFKAKGVSEFDLFFSQFKMVNFDLWNQYDRGLITSDVIRCDRFKRVLQAFNAYEPTLCEALTQDYMERCPNKCNLMPHALETLDYLSQHYTMTIITNGFEEIQNIKLTGGKMHLYFDHVITSQKAGHRKPAKEIFEYALRLNGIHHHEAIMIGDNPLTDIGGAQNASIDTVLFNPEKITHNVFVHYEINTLKQLRDFL